MFPWRRLSVWVKSLPVNEVVFPVVPEGLSSSLLDLAPGNDEIYEETQEKFLTAGNPQDGQVVLYKVRVAV